MIGTDSTGAMAGEAAAWVVRLSGDRVEEADWLAFADWLERDPVLHRQAFDRAQAVWLDADGLAQALPVPRRVGRTLARRAGLAAGAAIAAGAALMFAPALVHPTLPSPPARTAMQVTATRPGERRALVLPDGSRVALDGASRLAVAPMGRGPRIARLLAGEAVFDIVHDPARPFVVFAGPARVRVLGTAFDLVRTAEMTTVSVSRGAVSFDAGGRTVRVPAGRAATLSGAVVRLDRVDPADVGSWRTGRRLYWDQRLSVVVSDLNRSYPRPVRLGDDSAARLRFSGVLVLGPEQDTVRRLTALLPLRAEEASDGAIVLSSKGPSD
jgi:transmembrane sensor